MAEEKKTTAAQKPAAKKPAAKKTTSTAKKTTTAKKATASKSTAANKPASAAKKTTAAAKKPAAKKTAATKTVASKVADNVQKTAQDKTENSHVEYDQKGVGSTAPDQTPQVEAPKGFWSWWRSLGLGISGNVIIILIIIGISYEIIKHL